MKGWPGIFPAGSDRFIEDSAISEKPSDLEDEMIYQDFFRIDRSGKERFCEVTMYLIRECCKPRVAVGAWINTNLSHGTSRYDRYLAFYRSGPGGPLPVCNPAWYSRTIAGRPPCCRYGCSHPCIDDCPCAQHCVWHAHPPRRCHPFWYMLFWCDDLDRKISGS